MNLNAIELPQLRGQHRVDGVGRPKFDFHTGHPKAGLPAHRLYRPNLVEGIE